MKKIEFRRHLDRPLRVGGIDYLNSRPLIETLDEVAGEEVDVSNHPPRELARRLRGGELDVALVPVVEYFFSSKAADYWVVPGIGISSYGAVGSIRLFHRKPLSKVKRVALDATSMTSQLLTRLLFEVRPGVHWQRGRESTETVEFSSLDPHEILPILEDDRASPYDAVLLIGDSALRARPGEPWQARDLGLEWTRWTGLPFVYAVWVYRGDPLPGLADCFLRARHSGYARIDRIVERGPLPEGMSRGEALRYLAQVIRYGLDEAEIEGLQLFIEHCCRNELVSSAARDLRFLDEESRAARQPVVKV